MDARYLDEVIVSWDDSDKVDMCYVVKDDIRVFKKVTLNTETVES